MILLFFLLVLAWGFYIGYQRGLLLQVYYLILLHSRACGKDGNFHFLTFSDYLFRRLQNLGAIFAFLFCSHA